MSFMSSTGLRKAVLRKAGLRKTGLRKTGLRKSGLRETSRSDASPVHSLLILLTISLVTLGCSTTPNPQTAASGTASGGTVSEKICQVIAQVEMTGHSMKEVGFKIKPSVYYVPYGYKLVLDIQLPKESVAGTPLVFSKAPVNWTKRKPPHTSSSILLESGDLLITSYNDSKISRTFPFEVYLEFGEKRYMTSDPTIINKPVGDGLEDDPCSQKPSET